MELLEEFLRGETGEIWGNYMQKLAVLYDFSTEQIGWLRVGGTIHLYAEDFQMRAQNIWG